MQTTAAAGEGLGWGAKQAHGGSGQTSEEGLLGHWCLCPWAGGGGGGAGAGGGGGALPLQTRRAVVFPGLVLGTYTSLLWLMSEDLTMVPFLHWHICQETGSGVGARQKQVRNRKSSSQVR